jgi:transcriptional regulator with XRE-family HTH domain
LELNEKLQELRKQKELTQEELAEILFVSRTAISKWESGRGYPNIDSLKACIMPTAMMQFSGLITSN